jgi:tetratricopeptide (TPR) repeat protein
MRTLSTFHVAVVFCLFAQFIAGVGNERYSNIVAQARLEYRNGSYHSAEKSFLAALQVLDVRDLSGRAKTLAELGSTYTNEDQLAKAEQAFGQSLTMYRQVGDKKHVALGLRHLGALYSLERRDDQALRALEQALNFAKADHDTALQADVLNVIDIVYYRQRKNIPRRSQTRPVAASVAFTPHLF